ncbi:MAG TPA: AAA family ATPase [Acidimicrobiales bacterium]|nr:AAA family ATPase [Acidimicrobiales bacterium]
MPGPAIVITGAPCAGKSTVAAALVVVDVDDPTAGDPTALVDLDNIRGQVKSGYRLPMAVIPPPDETLTQWQLAVDICGDMARRYAAAGYASVVDAPGIYVDGAVPWEPYTHGAWRRALDGVDWRLVVLQPDVELVCERARARQGFRQPPEGILRAIHAAMEAWRGVEGVTVLDNSALTVAETAAAVEEARRR